MAPRLKVLISAYACEPNKGSEPEVGWQLALHMAQHHEVTVLTRANNQANIEEGLRAHSGPRPNFIYYDLAPWVLGLKRRGLPVSVYYFFWQIGAARFMRNQLHPFDLIHHGTFNSFRDPGCWWFCGKPVLLGPLGGGQICPWRFLPWFRKQIVQEILRSLSVANSYLFPHIYLSFFFADKILAANEDTARCVPWLFQPKVGRMLETAVTPGQIIETRPPRDWSGARLLWISRLDKLKGGELVLRAFAHTLKTVPGLTLTMVGRGREEIPLKRLTQTLQIEASVNWRGSVPKAQVVDLMLRHDAFVFTSLRDTSGNVVLEAMAAGLPVITFCHHGVAEITTDQTALRVPITTRSHTVVTLAHAMSRLANSAELRQRLGNAGRDRVRQHYTWDQHALKMSGEYGQLLDQRVAKTARKQVTLGLFLVPKGILLAIGILLLVGASGFFTVGVVKEQARAIVSDTLPGLSYSGQANASLSQAFNRTLLFLLAENPEQRAELRRQIDEFSRVTTAMLEAYGNQVGSGEDRATFEQLLGFRAEYFQARAHAMQLAEAQQRDEAVAVYKSELLPAFQRYKEAGDRLFDFNLRESKTRGHTIMTVCTSAQFLVAAIGILLFIVGFLIGLSR